MSYRCNVCNYFTTRTYDLKKHNKSLKHVKNVSQGINMRIIKQERKSIPNGSQTVPKFVFKCDYCDKIFTRKGNLNKHLVKFHDVDNRKFILSNKFEQKDLCETNIPDKVFEENITSIKITQNISCKYCNKKLSRHDALLRHYKICNIKNDHIKNLEHDNETIKKLKQENKNMKKQICEKDKMLIKKDDIIDNTTKANKHAMNTFNILVKEFVNSPALRNINKNDIETIIYKDVDVDDERDWINALIYYHNNKRLSHHIGNSIVSLYKKDDPHTQSFWNSDTQRLSYVIRIILDDDFEWKRDIGGKKILKLVIDPVLNYIDTKVRNHIQKVSIDKFINEDELNDHLLEAHKLSRDLKDKKNLRKVILNYITPFFSFPTNNLLE